MEIAERAAGARIERYAGASSSGGGRDVRIAIGKIYPKNH